MTGPMWVAAARTLARVAELGEREGVVFCLENLNTAVDHPGTPFARAADTRSLVQAVDSPHLRMNLDLYHAQIGEGNLVELVRESVPWVGEVQVADVPGRCEPGTGEIHYPAVARALRDAGYAGVVGLEAFASGRERGGAGALPGGVHARVTDRRESRAPTPRPPSHHRAAHRHLQHWAMVGTEVRPPVALGRRPSPTPARAVVKGSRCRPHRDTPSQTFPRRMRRKYCTGST